MREEHVVYYTLKVFHEWFNGISARLGDAGFSSVVQNCIYYPDQQHPEKSHLEFFVKDLIKFIDRLRKMPDDKIRIRSLEIKGVYVNESGTSQPRVDSDVGDSGIGGTTPPISLQSGNGELQQPTIFHHPV